MNMTKTNAMDPGVSGFVDHWPVFHGMLRRIASRDHNTWLNRAGAAGSANVTLALPGP